jgi:DNA-binding MarR family transcriptional regulator
MNVLRKKLQVDILLHLKRAGVDYGKSISRALDAPLASVLAALEELEAAGLVERVGGRVLKRDKARMKTAHEVRKHHVYFRLSRTGELLLRCLRARGPAAYLEAMTGEEKKALVDACRGGQIGASGFGRHGACRRRRDADRARQSRRVPSGSLLRRTALAGGCALRGRPKPRRDAPPRSWIPCRRPQT